VRTDGVSAVSTIHSWSRDSIGHLPLDCVDGDFSGNEEDLVGPPVWTLSSIKTRTWPQTLKFLHFLPTRSC
jgi:hypothetical protein